MLKKLLEIDKNDIITVVGAGGKTSLITYLTKQFSSEYKVLLTTTTKIYLPKSSDYDNKIMLTKKSDTFIINKGITLCGRCINDENKVIGLNFDDLDNLVSKFDISFIEGDGSKRKKLKGWKDDEPLVYKKTTKTIGVLDITSYDMYINDKNIHRLDKFINICGLCNNKITLENLKNIVLHEQGLFKNSKGQKILFINKVENRYREKLVKDLIKLIRKENYTIDIVYGSLIKNYYRRV